MQKQFIVYRNGKMSVQNADDFTLHDSALGFTENPRVFTTLLAHPTDLGRSILGLDLHLARLASDAHTFHLPYAVDCLRKPILETLADFARSAPAGEPIRMRVTLSRDAVEIFLDLFERRYPAEMAIGVRLFSAERPYPETKTTLTETSLAAHEFALQHKCFEALLVNREGRVAEGAWSNVFWFDSSGALFRPNEKALPGVTAALIANSHPVTLASATSEDLTRAAEVFMTQSTHGITAVGSIEGKQIGTGEPGPNTTALIRWYEGLKKREEASVDVSPS